MSGQHIECPVCGKNFRVKPSHLAKRVCCSKACLSIRLKNTATGSDNPNWRGGKVTLRCIECDLEFFVIPALVSVRKCCGRKCLAVHQSKTRSGDASSKWKGGRNAARARYLDIARTNRLKRETNCNPRLKVSPNGRLLRTCKACGQLGVKKGLTYHPECKPKRKCHFISFTCQDCGVTKTICTKPGRNQKRCRQCCYKARKGAGNSNWKGGVTTESHKIRNSERYIAWRKKVFKRDNYTCQFCGQRGGCLNADHIKPFSTYPYLRFVLSNGRTLCKQCHKKTDTYLGKVKKTQAKANQKAGFLPFQDFGFA